MTEPLQPGGVCPRTPEGISAHQKEVRAASPADLPACAGIMNDYIDATEWLPRGASRDEIAAIFGPELLNRRRVFVADEGGTVVGYASFDEGEGFLHALYLAPAARGRGLGKALLDAVKAVGAFELTVWQANPAARQFYEREGLVLVGESVDDDGLPVWRMRWALVLRPAHAGDAVACARIVDGWIAATPWMPRQRTLAEIEASYRERMFVRRAVTVAELAGEVAGFVAVAPEDGEVTSLFVGPRGRSVGSALLMAEQARAERLWLWTFQVNEGARRFYVRHGFAEVETTSGENKEGLPDVRLVWAA